MTMTNSNLIYLNKIENGKVAITETFLIQYVSYNLGYFIYY